MTPALDRHLRSCARHAARPHVNQEIRARGAQRPAFLRLLAYVYAAMPGYRPSWQPVFTERRVSADPVTGLLLERWRTEERLAREAAAESGLDFSWREVDCQDGQGLVIDGEGRPLWEVAVYPDHGFAISRYGPGRVLRELTARREILASLDLSTKADKAILRLLEEPYGE
ncbi:hypothetical protein D0T12_15540 [Actinomadura spongiicola]|uniref:Uncharacterized protein n=1 Tax=Actinomadura spongiicola TaxID=2303421 RepID=A0A372GHT4_9ACTN|nr:hypothetical protein [Actinomadura spongiicola]RFS84917.1 hypothetical protein D0T12_15540 [Actinomadura spongiicola]